MDDQARKRPPRRVFISHASELRQPQRKRSYVDAAERAIIRAGDAVVNMAYFAASSQPPAEACAEAVAACDIYVCLAGVRYGTPVVDRPNMSYTEWEFDVAARIGIPRLAFLVGTMLAAGTVDARQQAFRERLDHSGLVTVRVSSPVELELSLFHALVQLNGDPSGSTHTRWTLPALDGFIVERPELMTPLLDALLAPGLATVEVSMRIHGAGGFGKTVLALQACYRPEVRGRYHGGIIWITLGEQVRGTELAAKIDDLCEQLTGSRPSLSDPEQAGFRLGEILDGRPDMLLVVDDVWTIEQLRPFLSGGGRCRRLITTRNQRLLGANVVTVFVDALNNDQAQALLLHDVPNISIRLIDEILNRTGGWPLLLALVNGTIRHMIRNSVTIDEAAERTLARLIDIGPHGLDLRTAVGRNETVRATVEASLALLSLEDRDRYYRLSVLFEDSVASSQVLWLLWGADEWGSGGLTPVEAEAFCEELADLSLVLRQGGDQRGIKLHDVLYNYLRSVVGPRLLAEMNNRFLRAAASRLESSPGAPEPQPIPWWRLPWADEYLWRHVVQHLQAAGREAECDQLATDLRWIDGKVRRLGPVAAELDLAASDTEVARRLSVKIAQNAHILVPIHPSWALTDILVSRLDCDQILRVEMPDELNLTGRPRLVNAWELPDQPHPALRRILLGHQDAVWGLAIAPDGLWLVTGSTDGTARIWDARNGMTKSILAGHTGRVNCCAIEPHGRWVVTGSDDTTLRIWDPSNGECLQVLRHHTDWVWSCAVSGDGRRLVSVGDDRAVRLWSTDTWSLQARLVGHLAGVNACAIEPNGRLLATGADDLTVRIWDLPKGIETRVLQGHDDWVKACSISGDGSVLVTAGGADLSVRVWDTSSWRVRSIYMGHTDAVRGCAVSPDGTWAASAGSDRSVRLWDCRTGGTMAILYGHTSVVRACAISPDGSWLASAGDDGTARIWSARTATQAVESRHRGSVWACDVTPDGGWVVSGGEDGWIRLWDTETGALIREFASNGGPIRGLAVAPDGTKIVSANDDGTASVWDVATGGLQTVLNGHEGWVKDCVILAEGSRVVTCGGDPVLKVWDAATGQLQVSITGYQTWIWDCDVSPQGDRVAAACDDGTVHIHDLTLGERLTTLIDHQGPVRACAFTAGGRWLVSGGDDRILRLWDVDSGSLLRAWTEHGATIWGCDPNPTRDLIASVGEDSVVRVWDPELSDGPVAAMRVNGALRACRWSPDGKILVLGGDAGVYCFHYIQQS